MQLGIYRLLQAPLAISGTADITPLHKKWPCLLYSVGAPTKPLATDLLASDLWVVGQGHQAVARFKRLDVPKEFLGRLIGTGGAAIRALEESSGARLVVGQDNVHAFLPSPDAIAAVEAAISSAAGTEIKVRIVPFLGKKHHFLPAPNPSVLSFPLGVGKPACTHAIRLD